MSLPLPKQRVIEALQCVPRVFMAGRVTKVLGLIIEGSLPDVPVGALCKIYRQNSGDTIDAEVIGLRENQVILMPIGTTAGLQVGDSIEVCSQSARVQVSAALLGRIVDGCGTLIDDGAPLSGGIHYPLYSPASSPIRRQMITQPISLGVKAIDGLITCGIGQRMAILAGSGVGKSTLIGMMAREARADINVIGLIGERGREVREFIENSLGKEGTKKSIVVVATSDAPPLIRMRAAFVATTIAEYFRDQNKTVLLMMDSLTRFAMASREIGLAMGEPPTVKGYTPSLFGTLPRLLERAGTTEGSGSITGLYTILTEADDINDPVADAVRAIVDGHIVLSRKLALQGQYPPIDILQSLSRVMPHVVTSEHEEAMIQIRKYLALYADMEDYIKMGFYSEGKNPELDVAVKKHAAITEYLAQRSGEVSTLEEAVSKLTYLAQMRVA